MNTSSEYLPESPAAKLWELLRRNRAFRSKVKFLTTLRDRCESKTDSVRRRALEMGMNLFAQVRDEDSNAFAYLALQWLVPQPLFIERKAIAEELDSSANSLRLRFTKIGRGISAKRDDGTWKWFTSRKGLLGSAESQANAAVWPLRWGPRVTKTIIDDPRFAGSYPDEIAEWEAWFDSHTFTVNTPWEGAPPGFRRDWEALWKNCSGCGLHAAEIDFFRDWQPWDIVKRSRQELRKANQCIRDLVADLGRVQRGMSEVSSARAIPAGKGSMRRLPVFRLHLSETEKVRLIQFDALARARVILLPPMMSRMAARTALRRLTIQLAKELPKTHELFGSKAAWTVRLAYEKHRGDQKVDFGKAMGALFRSRVKGGALMAFGIPPKVRERWVKEGELQPLPENSTPAEVAERRKVGDALKRSATEERQRNRHFDKWVRFIDELSESTFPRLSISKLERKTPS